MNIEKNQKNPKRFDDSPIHESENENETLKTIFNLKMESNP